MYSRTDNRFVSKEKESIVCFRLDQITKLVRLDKYSRSIKQDRYYVGAVFKLIHIKVLCFILMQLYAIEYKQ